jgi:hypothetical protein
VIVGADGKEDDLLSGSASPTESIVSTYPISDQNVIIVCGME